MVTWSGKKEENDPDEPEMTRADVKFQWGCQNGNIGAVEHWLEQGADVNLMAKSSTPLLRCAGSYQDKPEILEYILDRGADTDIMIPTKNHPHHTALHLAALLGHCGIVKVLIENGADVNAVNADGVTPLAMNELYEQQFGITVERRQKEIIAGKRTIQEDLTAAGAVMNVADLEKKADEAPAAPDEAPAAPADGEDGIKEEIAQSPSTEATPPPTEMATPATPATPANATDSPAQSMTPIGRVERLEAAMNKDGAGGVIARLTEIEAELLGEKQAGTIPERLQQLEESMGL